MILEQIAASTRKRVEQEKAERPPERVRERAMELAQAEAPLQPASFRSAIASPGLSFICEFKKASPSKGLIAPDFRYREIAGEYDRAGADAVSVLTEPEYFLGCSRYLEEIHREIPLPLLRKDFVVDEYQIYEAKVLGASAVLLICALLNERRLARYLEICRSLGMDALVEAHDDREVAMAAGAGAGIIGINNRNLKTFEVDFSNALRLRSIVPPGTLFVAESGIRSADHIRLLAQAGVDAVLIGETLMRAEDKAEVLREFRKAAGPCQVEVRAHG